MKPISRLTSLPRSRGQTRRSLVRELFAATTIGLLTVVVAASTAPSAAARPGDQPITQLNVSMLVDQSSFPNIPGSAFVRQVSGNRVDLQVNPPECAPLAVGYNTPQSGYAGLVMTQGRLDITITVTSNPPDVNALENNCGSVSGSGIVPGVMWHITPLPLTGVPSWAGSVAMDGDATVFGTYRGVFIKSSSGMDRPNDAVKLFNDQVAKLAAV